MVKYFKNFLLLICIVLFTSIVLSYIFQPRKYYWGNKGYANKIEWFTKNKNQFNTVFYGSSRTNSHIIPLLFDSLLSTTLEVNSFNFGVPGGFSPEHYILYEHFLQSDASSDVKYAIIELTTLTARQPQNIFKDRVTYWMNFENILFISKTILSENYGITTKAYRIYSFISGYLYKTIALKNVRQRMFKRAFGKETYDTRGYTPLYSEERKGQFNVKALDHITQKQIKFENDMAGVYLNNSHLNKLKNIIRLSKEKNIQPIFLIPPRTDLRETYGLANELSAYIIDLSNSVKYADFYKPEFSYDGGHLNNNGAALFTNALGHQAKNKFN